MTAPGADADLPDEVLNRVVALLLEADSEESEASPQAESLDGASSREGRLGVPRLAELGITKNQSSRWQKLEEMPREPAHKGTRPRSRERSLPC
jgi:hypothetical protein